MRLDEAAQNERALKGAEYYLSQLALFNAHLPGFLEVEIDNKETAKAVADAGNELFETLKVKVACLRAVKEKGYSVQTVQRAKVNILLNKEEKKKGRERSQKQAKQHGDENINNDLFTALRNWRALKAEDQGVPVYVILWHR